jgi:serine phosphatase RsbU (regulator of sigma subunit)
VQAFNFITIGTNMWAFLVRRQNRAIAAALVIIPVASALRNIGIPIAYVVGNVSVDFFSLGFLVSATALFITLGQRARAGWRSRDELRVEFEAAREVQQQLVAPAVDVPGFKIDSVYAPAKQVGGDFFRVLPEPGGSVLVVVGDVSGKGLRAAMTVSAIIGALRTMPSLSPPRILSDLNRGLAGQLRGGFVTCCVARIGADGEVAIANAGHFSPYRAGAEVDIPAGFPLGLVPDATYDEAHFRLHSGEVLTFLSDGVIEARNSSGELFGFERTLAISTSSAETIAQAAIDFGQDDDITVLTLTNLPAARLDPDPHKGPMLVTA